ncbi:MAG: hypothetical protein ACOYYS_21820 [Chloroflexota bacterium]
MTEQICRLAIAHIHLEVCCASTVLADRLRQRYAAFAGAAEPGLRVRVIWQHTLQLDDALPPVPPSDAFVFEKGKLSFDTPGYRGEVDLAASDAWLSLNARSPLEGVEYFLRAIYALLLFEAGGVLLHGAGLVRDRRAYVFFGHSGSGKTTASRLSRGVVVLNDDLVALLPDSGGWVVHATPFWNPTQVVPVRCAAPLAGLYRLVQDRCVWLEQISPGQAVAELAANIPVVSADASRSDRLVMRCAQLVRQIGVKRLHFLKDDSFWQAIL